MSIDNNYTPSSCMVIMVHVVKGRQNIIQSGCNQPVTTLDLALWKFHYRWSMERQNSKLKVLCCARHSMARCSCCH